MPASLVEKISNRIFYGWIIVGSVIISGFILMGVNSSFGVFFKSLEDAYNLTRASTSLILSVRMIFSGLAAMLSGWAIDRFGPRMVFTLMGLFTGLSLVLTGLTTASWHIFFTYGLLIAMGTGAVYVVITATIMRWFHRKRGLALGITGAGGGIGTAVISPAAASLITWIEWRNTMLLLGIFSWLLMIPSSQLLRNSPEDIGTHPDGIPSEKSLPSVPEGGMTDQPRSPVRKVLQTRNFRAIFLTWMVMAFSSFFIMTHIVPHAEDIGYSPVESAGILSFSGLAMIAGRLITGVISEKVDAKIIAIGSSIIQCAAFLSLIWIEELWWLYLFGIINGITFGSFGMSVTLLIGRSFTLTGIGTILGLLEVGIFVGGAVGPYLGGFLFDISGSYSPAFMVTGIMVLLRIALIMMVKPEY